MNLENYIFHQFETSDAVFIWRISHIKRRLFKTIPQIGKLSFMSRKSFWSVNSLQVVSSPPLLLSSSALRQVWQALCFSILSSLHFFISASPSVTPPWSRLPLPAARPADRLARSQFNNLLGHAPGPCPSEESTLWSGFLKIWCTLQDPCADSPPTGGLHWSGTLNAGYSPYRGDL